MKIDVTIEGCPYVFHDILELCDFLVNLTPRYLFMFDQCVVLINGFRFAWISVVYRNLSYRISYITYPIR